MKYPRAFKNSKYVCAVNKIESNYGTYPESISVFKSTHIKTGHKAFTFVRRQCSSHNNWFTVEQLYFYLKKGKVYKILKRLANKRIINAKHTLPAYVDTVLEHIMERQFDIGLDLIDPIKIDRSILFMQTKAGWENFYTLFSRKGKAKSEFIYKSLVVVSKKVVSYPIREHKSFKTILKKFFGDNYVNKRFIKSLIKLYESDLKLREDTFDALNYLLHYSSIDDVCNFINYKTNLITVRENFLPAYNDLKRLPGEDVKEFLKFYKDREDIFNVVDTFIMLIQIKKRHPLEYSRFKQKYKLKNLPTKELHDLLANIILKLRHKLVNFYDTEPKPIYEDDKHIFQLVGNSHELVEIATKLANCSAGEWYINNAVNKRIALIKIFNKKDNDVEALANIELELRPNFNKLTCPLEYEYYRLIEISGKYNKPVPEIRDKFCRFINPGSKVILPNEFKNRGTSENF